MDQLETLPGCGSSYLASALLYGTCIVPLRENGCASALHHQQYAYVSMTSSIVTSAACICILLVSLTTVQLQYATKLSWGSQEFVML